MFIIFDTNSPIVTSFITKVSTVVKQLLIPLLPKAVTSFMDEPYYETNFDTFCLRMGIQNIKCKNHSILFWFYKFLNRCFRPSEIFF